MDSTTRENLHPKPRNFCIVTPVLDDWLSLEKLLDELSKQEELQGSEIAVIVVDDGSVQYDRPKEKLIKGPIKKIQVLRLRANQSHQRAIALGLAHVRKQFSELDVLVMDSDGEDRVEEIAYLLIAADKSPGSIIVAKRRRRSEGLQFRVGYFAYKLLFSLLTGRNISFGNFSFLPSTKVDNILYNSNIWNNFAATILRSRSPIEFLETDRGQRYFGESKMNLTSLMVHGLSAIAVFSDVVISRLIIGLFGISILFIVSVVSILSAKIVIEYYNIEGLFIPGYTTNLILALVNILVSCLFIGLVMILNLLTARSQAPALPSRLADELIKNVDDIS